MITKIKKRKKGEFFQNILLSVLIGISLLGVVGFLVVSNLRINQKRTELISKIESLKKEIQVLEEKKEKIEAGITQTESETYWEEKLREQGYKRPGEETVVVLPPEEKEEKVEEEKSFWEKIINFFRRD
jgi:cell division protein FtsB